MRRRRKEAFGAHDAGDGKTKQTREQWHEPKKFESHSLIRKTMVLRVKIVKDVPERM